MSLRFLLPAALSLLSAQALAQPTEQRPVLKGVTAIRVANYNSPSIVVHAREDVREAVDEVNQLRKKRWLKADSKLSCYSTVVFLAGEKQLALFRVTAERMVEKTLEKIPSSYSLAVEDGELLKLTALLAEAQPAKNCE